MRFTNGIVAFSALATLVLSSTAGAVQTPAEFARRPVFEVAQGSPVRLGADLQWHRVPARHQRAWSRLQAAMGPRTWAAWDPDTQVVRRIWGEGVAIAGSTTSDVSAERAAREFLAQHIALLAPGARATDFDLVANDLRGGMRTVGFVQRAGGLPVAGGQVSFRFKNDRLFMIASEALPSVPAPAAVTVSDAAAAAAALAWVQKDLAPAAIVTGHEGARVLPLIRAGGVEYRTVLAVEVTSAAPRGRWRVYVDAASGRPVAREQTLRFASGTLKYNAAVRMPGGMRQDYGANQASLTVDGANVTSGKAGEVTWNSNVAANVTARVTGKQFNVSNDSGPDATTNLNLPPNGTAVWNAANDQFTDAQVTTFVHANIVMDYVRPLDPGNPFLTNQFDAIVNINDSCNAFYDGNALNFFSQSQQCNNTGRIADIVYHEFGHGVHDHAIIQGVGVFEPALSEGVSDYLSATITDDPKLAVGFFLGDNTPLRHLDDKDWKWPDDIDQDPHLTGIIIAGALWDLRKALVQDQGQAGVQVADRLYYESISRAVDIPSMYFEAIAADDDDGNLDNGTPNECLINQAFALHGLYKLSADVSAPDVAQPQLAGYEVSVAVGGGGGGCQGGSVEKADLVWRLREQPQTGGTIPMMIAPDKIAGTIPMQPEGSVVQYQVKLTFSDQSVAQYPENRADPFFEFFVGAVEDIYCTGFETDPQAEGWTHGLTQGMQGEGADDWMWGEPMAPIASGDPQEAFEGSRVWGNDLGGGNYNGTYQPDKVNFSQTPAIDTTGYGQVRLQYRRWLNVEDGFFDRATIYANGQPAWQNLRTPNEADANVSHTDNVWRFHDVDLTKYVQNNSVTLKFELQSDPGLELGGWTIDKFCVVGVVDAPDPVCGDGILSVGEACDNGAANSDTQPDACRTDCSLAGCGDSVVDSGEDCDDGNTIDGDGCPANCGNESGTGSDSDSGGITSVTGGDPTEGGGGGSSGGSTMGPTSITGFDGEAPENSGCGCQQERGGGVGLSALALALLGLRRRRSR